MSSNAHASSGGDYIWIIGYGSLMSEASARRTVQPVNFGVAILKGWRRHFNLVSITNLKNGAASLQTKEIAAVSSRPGYPDSTMLVSLFQIPANEEGAYRKREGRYQYTKVSVTRVEDVDVKRAQNLPELVNLSKDSEVVEAVMCYEFNDEDFRKQRFKTHEDYMKTVGKYYEGLLWRKDIFPVRRYLRLCVNAARDLGGQIGVQNFLETSYLANEEQTIGAYLFRNPSIMEEDN
uniref:Gamma-glutamylcyclotransferase n=1 Tax=Aplanochytrium stocchinoi TaxID=215587 RepID=A0A7S3LJD4_9STRA